MGERESAQELTLGQEAMKNTVECCSTLEHVHQLRSNQRSTC